MDANGQDDRDNRREFLWDGTHGEGHGAIEHLSPISSLRQTHDKGEDREQNDQSQQRATEAHQLAS